MIRFSANLGFLWTELSLPDAIRAAGRAGFDAVECHMPYDWPTDVVASALDEAGLEMVSLNTRVGDRDGDLGVAALPDRVELARSYIGEAIDYAQAISCHNVSVVAGRSGRSPGSESVYRDNLAFAAGLAQDAGCGVLIEPLNTGVAADYHLTLIDQGIATIDAVGAENLRLMVDCHHASIMEGELLSTFERGRDHLGHVQFAGVPRRNEPDTGAVDYHRLLPAIVALGYDGPFGAEYNPQSTTEAGLGWLVAWHEERDGTSGESDDGGTGDA